MQAWTAADQQCMDLAFEQARCALTAQEVPIGCVIVREGRVLAAGQNKTNESRNV